MPAPNTLSTLATLRGRTPLTASPNSSVVGTAGPTLTGGANATTRPAGQISPSSTFHRFPPCGGHLANRYEPPISRPGYWSRQLRE